MWVDFSSPQHRKSIIQSLINEKNSMNHAHMRKELPDKSPLTVKSYGNLVGNAGVMCKKLSEQVAGVKGSLGQRAKAAKAAS